MNEMKRVSCIITGHILGLTTLFMFSLVFEPIAVCFPYKRIYLLT